MSADKRRSSSFELLRIIAMFMVVLGHCMMTTAKDQQPYLGMIDNIGWFVGAFTVCAVNVFFLMTGYFAKSENFSLRRIIMIWLKTIFYSVVIYVIFSFAGGTFQIRDFIQYMLPIMTKRYWYMQVYVIFALIAPFVSLLLEQLTKKQHTFLMVILITFFSVHQTFIKVSMTLDQSQGYGIIWAAVMFVIGNWIKRYGDEYLMRIKAWMWLILYILCSIAIFISNYLIVKLDIAGGVVSRGNFYAYNSVTVLFQSVFLFCYFAKLSKRMKYKRVINSLGQNTLSVYLISAHPLLLYPLWTDIFQMSQFWENPILYLLLGLILSAVLMLVCILIDKVIDWIIDKLGIVSWVTKADKLVDFILQG